MSKLERCILIIQLLLWWHNLEKFPFSDICLTELGFNKKAPCWGVGGQLKDAYVTSTGLYTMECLKDRSKCLVAVITQ